MESRYIKVINYNGVEVFSPTYDEMFKGILLFDNLFLLADFLSTALGKEIKPEGIHICSTELPADNIENKTTRLDLKVTLADGSIVNVEMQTINEYNMGKRSLYHSSRLMVGQVKKGMAYSDICPVIAINILDFEYIKDNRDFRHRYRMRDVADNTEMPDAETLEIHFFELPKLPANADNDRLIQWLKFFAVKTEEDIKMVLEKNRNVFGIAVDRLVQLSADEEMQEIMRKQEKYEMDRLSRESYCEKKGRAEERLETAKKMKDKNLSVDLIAEITGLPKELIERM